MKRAWESYLNPVTGPRYSVFKALTTSFGFNPFRLLTSFSPTSHELSPSIRARGLRLLWVWNLIVSQIKRRENLVSWIQLENFR